MGRGYPPLYILFCFPSSQLRLAQNQNIMMPLGFCLDTTPDRVATSVGVDEAPATGRQPIDPD